MRRRSRRRHRELRAAAQLGNEAVELRAGESEERLASVRVPTAGVVTQRVDERPERQNAFCDIDAPPDEARRAARPRDEELLEQPARADAAPPDGKRGRTAGGRPRQPLLEPTELALAPDEPRAGRIRVADSALPIAPPWADPSTEPAAETGVGCARRDRTGALLPAHGQEALGEPSVP